MMQRLRLFVLWWLVVCFGVVSAQDATCPEIVDEALNAVDTLCGAMERNTACYGNVQLSATAQVGVEDFRFAAVGDIANLADIDTLELSPLDEAAEVWGMAVLSLQADIPDSLPGQNVTFILFGDVTIENAAGADQTPMQAFYLRTGISDSACETAPESGLLVQTPDGVEAVTFNINGVDVQVGSTVLFQAQDELTVTTVEGTAILDFENEVYPAIAGTQLRLPLNEQGLPTSRPGFPEAYDENRVNLLPLRPLPRAILPPPPLATIDLATLHERLQAGQPPCDVPGLSPCADLPAILRDAPPLPPPDSWGMQFIPGENCVPPAEFVPGQMPAPGEPRPLPPCPLTERPPRPDGQRLWCIVLPGPLDPPLAPDENRPICPNNQPITVPDGNLPPPPGNNLPPRP
jgi:hypothetical protein